VGILDRIFGNRKEPEAGENEIADAIIDRIVESTDKRLALVSGYRKILRDCALTTLEHLRALLQVIPGPIDVGAAAWAQDHSLHAMLARAEDAPRAFSADGTVRAFFESSAAEHCLALFGLEHTERHVLAPALVGEQVQHGVARTTVSFDHPRVLAPSAEMQTLRIELGKRMIDFLAMRAMEQVSARRDEKKALENERALLKARLALAERAGRGLTGLAAAEAKPRSDAATIARELSELEKQLAGFSSTGLMQELLETVRGTYGSPSMHLRHAVSSLSLDAMNFKVESSQKSEFSLQVVDLWLANRAGERGPFAVIIARFPRSELLPSQRLLAEAQKFAL